MAGIQKLQYLIKNINVLTYFILLANPIYPSNVNTITISAILTQINSAEEKVISDFIRAVTAQSNYQNVLGHFRVIQTRNMKTFTILLRSAIIGKLGGVRCDVILYFSLKLNEIEEASPMAKK